METRELTSRYLDKGGDRSTHIEVEIKKVETGVLTSRYRDKSETGVLIKKYRDKFADRSTQFE